jgi:hypothetical protein
MEAAQQQYRSNGGRFESVARRNRRTILLRRGVAQRLAATARKNAIELPKQIDTLKNAIELPKRAGPPKNAKETEIEKELGEKVRDGSGNQRN